MRKTVFISDLHLCSKHPEIFYTAQDFLRQEAVHIEALYILGDLFEVWLGDDIQGQVAREFAQLIHALRCPCFYIHGNRDFLLGAQYAQQSGLQLLPEHYVMDLYGRRTLLLHGDTLCTQDKDYQRLRRLLRYQPLQHTFLSLPEKWRRAIGSWMRNQSREIGSKKSRDLMDVSEVSVRKLLAQHQVKQMIHGHIHKPKIHTIDTREITYMRIVLGDWSQQASVLEYYPDHQFALRRFGLRL